MDEGSAFASFLILEVIVVENLWFVGFFQLLSFFRAQLTLHCVLGRSW
jgi:hypothetical protein